MLSAERHDTILSAREPRDVPAAVRSLSPLDPHYADAFSLVAPDAGRWSAEQWARALLDDVAGRTGQLLWRGLMGMRLGPRRGPDRIAGWAVGGTGAGWIRVEARSRSLTGHLVVVVEDDRVSLATFVRYDRGWGRAVWTPLSAVHRRVAPGFLGDGLAWLRELGATR